MDGPMKYTNGEPVPESFEKLYQELKKYPELERKYLKKLQALEKKNFFFNQKDWEFLAEVAMKLSKITEK